MGQLARAAIVMWLLLVAALAVCAVVAIGAALNSGPKPQHARPRHLAAVPDPPEVGSMDLDAERALGIPLPALLAAPVDPEPWRPDWREQTMAELSPAALDPGPGGGSDVVSSPPSGPDQAPPPRFTDPPTGGAGDWLEAQMADLFEWVRRVHAGATA